MQKRGWKTHLKPIFFFLIVRRLGCPWSVTFDDFQYYYDINDILYFSIQILRDHSTTVGTSISQRHHDFKPMDTPKERSTHLKQTTMHNTRSQRTWGSCTETALFTPITAIRYRAMHHDMARTPSPFAGGESAHHVRTGTFTCVRRTRSMFLHVSVYTQPPKANHARIDNESTISLPGESTDCAEMGLPPCLCSDIAFQMKAYSVCVHFTRFS